MRSLRVTRSREKRRAEHGLVDVGKVSEQDGSTKITEAQITESAKPKKCVLNREATSGHRYAQASTPSQL